MAEGMERKFEADGSEGWGCGLTTAVDGFQAYWQAKHGPESWDRNDWVWVAEFPPIDKPTLHR
jgi:hypothetical protein